MAVLIQDAKIAEALLFVMTNERAAYSVAVNANGKPLNSVTRQRQVQPTRTLGAPAMRMLVPFFRPQL